MPVFTNNNHSTHHNEVAIGAAAAAAAAEASHFLVLQGQPGPYGPRTSPTWVTAPLPPVAPFFGWPGPSYYPPAALQFDTHQLHPLLVGADPPHLHLVYDCRYKPDKSYIATTPPHHPYKIPEEITTSPAVPLHPMPRMRLVSELIPWPITVVNPKGVTVMDILTTIHDELDHPLTEGEWWIIPELERTRITDAFRHNSSGDSSPAKRRYSDKILRRIDWLGKHTMVLKLVRSPANELLIRSRVKDETAQSEAWVVELGDDQQW